MRCPRRKFFLTTSSFDRNVKQGRTEDTEVLGEESLRERGFAFSERTCSLRTELTTDTTGKLLLRAVKFEQKQSCEFACLACLPARPSAFSLDTCRLFLRMDARPFVGAPTSADWLVCVSLARPDSERNRKGNEKRQDV